MSILRRAGNPATVWLGLGLGLLAMGFASSCSNKPAEGPDAGTSASGGGGGDSTGAGGGGGGDIGTGGGGGGGGGNVVIEPGGNDAGTGGTSQTNRVCDPFAQTGCPTDKPKCGIVDNLFGCQAAGTAAVGAACTFTAAGDSCVTGAVCLNGTCERQCDPLKGGSACSGGEICNITVTMNGGAPNGDVFDVCSVVESKCDPLKQNCSGTGDGCYATNGGNKCLPAGTVADGAACKFANDCKKGSLCFDLGGGLKCFQACGTGAVTPPPNPDGGTSDAGAQTGGTKVNCTTGTCNMLGAEPGGTTYDYGLCQ